MPGSHPPKVSELGKVRAFTEDDFLRCFLSLIQTAKIHDDKYSFLKETAGQFIKAVLAYCREDEYCTLQVAKGRLFLQAEKVVYRKENKNLIENILLLLNERSLPGLQFTADIKNIEHSDLLSFIRHLDHADQAENPVEWLSLEIEKHPRPWVEIIALNAMVGEHGGEADTEQQGQGATEREKRVERARRDYTYVLSSFKEISKKLSADKHAGIRKSVRMVQNMVDHILEDEDIFSAMSTLRIYDDYTFTHSVNVGILSMTVGKRIGLNKIALERLGLCALFHDLGKIEVPLGILNKPGKLTEQEFKTLEKHSLDSARLIVKLRASSDRKAQIMLPPFEHHLKFNLTGYPHAGWKMPISLFGRIITIADVYDAITSARVYRPEIISPDRALGYMLNKSGVDFDPILLKIFINMMGVYPIGTLMELDTGELCLVKESIQDSFDARPRVVLLMEDERGAYIKGEEVDLDEIDPRSGNFKRNIKQTYHPSTMGIQPVQFIL